MKYIEQNTLDQFIEEAEEASRVMLGKLKEISNSSSGLELLKDVAISGKDVERKHLRDQCIRLKSQLDQAWLDIESRDEQIRSLSGANEILRNQVIAMNEAWRSMNEAIRIASDEATKKRLEQRDAE